MIRHGAFEQFFDLTADDVSTWREHCDEAVHPADRDTFRRFYQQLIDGDRTQGTLEYRTNPEHGRVHWIKDTVSIRTEASDYTRQAVGIARDITEYKEREQELEQTNALLSTLVDTLPQGILAEDESRNILAVNQRLFDLFEVPRSTEDIIGTDCRRLAEDASEMFATPEAFVRRTNEVVDTRDPVHGEELALQDGRTFARSYEPIALPDGEGHLWLYCDITDRKNREEHLKETSCRLEALFERSPDMINVHDIDGNLIDPNPQLLEKTGYDEAELTDMKVWELDQTITPDEAYAAWDDMEHGDRERFEGAYRRRDGSTFPVEVHVRRLDFDGEDRFLVISRDITDRKAREEQLERQNERLEEFASVVSHDLRNPLNVADGHLELAQENCDSEHLDAIARAHDRMRALIEDLLALAQGEETIDEDISLELATTVNKCWRNVETAGAELVVETDHAIRADQNRLKQLLENLFRNAVEHGGADVTVTVGDLPDGFYIADDGPGIPPDERDHVFGSGYSTTTEGTGFGLTIVQQVVNAHGWEIQITDSADDGAQFEITGVEVTTYPR